MLRWIFLILLITPSVLGLRINELMYNPQGDDDLREYVELYDEEIRNFSGYLIGDLTGNDTLKQLRSGTVPYAIMVEDDADLDVLGVAPDAAVYHIGTAIGNSLGNMQDAVFLYAPSGILLDSVSYDGTLANGNGKSLVRVDGGWQESGEIGGSPGRENTLTPTLPEPISGCRGNFTLSTDKLLYQSGEKVLMQFSTAEEVFTIAYWVEDLHGNVLRSPRNTSNANTKTFTAQSDEADQVLLVKARYVPSCGDVQERSVQIIVVGTGTPVENSSLFFRDPPTIATFGDTLTLELEAYRSKTRKSAVEISVVGTEGMKVSKTAKVSIAEQFQQTTASVELSLYENCNGKYLPGTYQLIAAGIDAYAEVPIELRNASCGGSIHPPINHSTSPRDALELSFSEFPGVAESGAVHAAVLIIDNPSAVTREVTLWSYAYRGSRSLSGDREANRQTLVAESGQTEIPLEITLDDVEPGPASYKALVLESGKKTPKELRETLEITDAQSQNDRIPYRKNITSVKSDLSPITGNVVYYAKTADIRRATLYFLLAACFAVISVLVWKGK